MKSADEYKLISPGQNALEPSWNARLARVFSQPFMNDLREFLRREHASGKKIFPPAQEIFGAFDSCPFDQVKVVILGQDPYHGPGQAHGLCFSVRKGTPVPPSLLNIFKEIRDEFGCLPPKDGDLTAWARQGVLLLNTVLTVEAGKPESHRDRGWEKFTDEVLDVLNREREGLVFVLWGSHAQAKARLIDPARHLILKAPHPSPLSAYRGFFGCGHFKKINEWLVARGASPICWVP
jgi:uracil-DNA glycosylase